MNYKEHTLQTLAKMEVRTAVWDECHPTCSVDGWPEVNSLWLYIGNSLLCAQRSCRREHQRPIAAEIVGESASGI